MSENLFQSNLEAEVRAFEERLLSLDSNMSKENARDVAMKTVLGRARKAVDDTPSAGKTVGKPTKARTKPTGKDSPQAQEMQQKVKMRSGAYDDPNKTYQLPLWPDLGDVRAIPNHIARSCLFAPIGRGGPRAGVRKTHTKAIIITSRSDVTIKYKGPQLDMADCDVFMQALQIAKKTPLGEPVFFVRSEFLAALKKSDAGAWYKWLDDSIDRLLEGTLYIETKRYIVGDPECIAEDGIATEALQDLLDLPANPKRRRPRKGLHLIAGYDYDDKNDAYYIMFDPRILAFFQNKEFALVDWERRFQIEKRIDLAKWLQNYISSHEPGVHTISLKFLKEWCGYTSPPNKFKMALEEALGELARLGVIANQRIRADGKVTWFRPPAMADAP